jgi:hypothetical protein
MIQRYKLYQKMQKLVLIRESVHIFSPVINIMFYIAARNAITRVFAFEKFVIINASFKAY